VLISLGSNLGERALQLRAAQNELVRLIHVVRVSLMRETEPIDAPAGSPRFLNMIVAGYTELPPETIMEALLGIEKRLGRRRTRLANAPRTIDLDLILHSAHMRRTEQLILPHARYLEREFVREPLRELGLGWRDPRTGVKL
jgi:2-amino-4-hydroxy-6-hydroxymethyldihydropteridine diphosphokinase